MHIFMIETLHKRLINFKFVFRIKHSIYASMRKAQDKQFDRFLSDETRL